MAGLIKYFVRHPVAPNLAMIIMIAAGLWASAQLTRQLLPNFGINQIEVSVLWPGSSAEDVESLVTQPLEDELQGLDELKSSSSTSREGLSRIVLEFSEGTDLSAAQDLVKDSIGQVRNLPQTSETPQVSIVARDEPVARLVLSGPDRNDLYDLTRNLERSLRRSGLSRLEITGLPKEEIAIELSGEKLRDLGLSLNDVADVISSESRDLPAGTVGSLDISRQIRSLDQRRTPEGFAQIPIISDTEGRFLKLGDIADIRRVTTAGETLVYADGLPAVDVRITRSETDDALDSAEQLYRWLEQTTPTLPPNYQITLYEEVWRTVDGRINLMVGNAFSGLLLVLAILFVFLNGRVAFWVSIGIPVSILASMVALYYFGGSINIMTLFAMIMTFGIIVDDAIVVGERAVTLYQEGAGPASASEKAAISMLAPVTAASLTTIAAFVPLLSIGGSGGQFLFSIPLIVICVVIASLIECFIVLPGHLHHSLKKTAQQKPARWRRQIDTAFKRFQDNQFRSFLSWAIDNRRLTVSVAVGSLIVIFGLLLGGRMGFSFFPQPEGTTITAGIRFVAGTPSERVEAFMVDVQGALLRAEKSLGEDIVILSVSKLNQDSRGNTGTNVGNLVVELTPGDQRQATNADLIRAWRRGVNQVPGLESFLILNSRGGPPGSDIDVQISGASPATLKAVSLEIQEVMRDFSGVSGIRDDTSYGQEQFVVELKPVGQKLGLSSRDLGEQIRASFEGELVQIFQDEGEEVEVRLRLAEAERETVRSLETLPILLPDGEVAILSDVATLDYAQGFDALKHGDGELAIRVTADVDPNVNNANAIRGRLNEEFLPQFAADYGVTLRQRGQAEDQAQSLGDITIALPLAGLLIFVILAWVFESYTWPFAVLSVVPFGLVGALFGHWLLNFDVTLLSIFGFFGLTGIVINDSIILVDVYRRMREDGKPVVDAVLDAGCARFRAVVLTSVTTVAGILPILLEGSQEAEFLKPMVISIGFGLIFGTFLVLILLPATLVVLEAQRVRYYNAKTQFKNFIAAQPATQALIAGLQKAQVYFDPSTQQPVFKEKDDSNDS